MKRQKREKWLLIATIVSIFLFFVCTIFLPPNSQTTLLNYTMQTDIIFFLFLFLAIFFTCSYLFRSFKHGILIGVFILSLSVLRLNHLLNLFFFLILLGLFTATEYLLK